MLLVLYVILYRTWYIVEQPFSNVITIIIITIHISHYSIITILAVIITIVIQYVRQDYYGWIEDKQKPTFTIAGEAITLDLHDTEYENWKIEPLTAPEVNLYALYLTQNAL